MFILSFFLVNALTETDGCLIIFMVFLYNFCMTAFKWKTSHPKAELTQISCCTVIVCCGDEGPTFTVGSLNSRQTRAKCDFIYPQNKQTVHFLLGSHMIGNKDQGLLEMENVMAKSEAR